MKKAFFDGWDNLGTLAIANFIFLIANIVWPVFISLKPASPMLLAVSAMIWIFDIMLLGVVSALMSALANHRRVSWADVPKLFRKTWRQCLIFGIITAGFVIISLLGIVYYSSLRSLPGFAASMTIFWIAIGAYLTALWYFPAQNRLRGGFGKLLKKCVFLMLDNFPLSLYLGVIMVPLFLIAWPMTAFGMFGPSGIQLYLNSALRLLLYKYDWLERNPDAKRNQVPWHEILVDEKERIGKRSIKGMIFPWKE